MEALLASSKCVAFFVQEIAESLEGVTAAGVKIKDAFDGRSSFGMWLDWRLGVFGVDGAKRSQTSGTALPDFLIEPLQYLRSQIVAVVLSHQIGRAHV